MFGALARLLTPDTSMAERYKALVERARNPVLFTQCGIPDTLDGRFESIVLHMAIECKRGISPRETRDLMEYFIEDMDRSLREIGVGDTGIGKRVKKMAAGLYGRLQAYAQAESDAVLKDVLLRNVYSTCETPPSDAAVAALLTYFKQPISAI